MTRTSHTTTQKRLSRQAAAFARMALAMLIIAVVASACSSSVDSRSSLSAEMSAEMAAPRLSESAAGSGERLAPAATPTPTPRPSPTPQPQLPPPEADEGAPLDSDVASDAASGRFNVCSLFTPERLGDVLGQFWTFEEGVASDETCLWLSSAADDSSVVASIALAPASTNEESVSTVDSDQGEGQRVVVSGNEFVVNVVSNDVDPTFGALNDHEAERRIADDLLGRVTESD